MPSARLAVTKFVHGAWMVVVVVPVMVWFLVRLADRYETEEEELEDNVQELPDAPALDRHVVLVLVDRLDPGQRVVREAPRGHRCRIR